MTLEQWILERCGATLSLAAAPAAPQLVDAVLSALRAAGYDYDGQVDALLEVSGLHCDDAFLEACMDRVARIEALQEQRRAVLARRAAQCQNAVSKRQPRPPAADVAALRFRALWDADDEACAVVGDMLASLAAHGYLPSDADSLRDLRQGLGYCRLDEDPLRLRRPVRWLQQQNTLHYWLKVMLDGDDPLIVPVGRQGRWITAAALFTDRDGHAYRHEQLQHGLVADDAERRWLAAQVPVRPTRLRP